MKEKNDKNFTASNLTYNKKNVRNLEIGEENLVMEKKSSKQNQDVSHNQEQELNND